MDTANEPIEDETTETADRLRTWFAETCEQVLQSVSGADSEQMDESLDPFDHRAGGIGLTLSHALVEAFTAMRQELKLQTKSVREMDEGIHDLVQQLESSCEKVDMARSELIRQPSMESKVVRSLVESIAGLDESFSRGTKALRNLERQMSEQSRKRIESLEATFRQLTLWNRWKARGWHAEVVRALREDGEKQQGAWQPLSQGFQLVESRLKQVFQAHGIERVRCETGGPVEPGSMQVVDVVPASLAAPAGTIVEELRPGYCWQGIVLRCAEVRAATEGTGS